MLENLFFAKHLEDDEAVSLIVHKYAGVAWQSLFWPSTLFLAGWMFLALAPVRTALVLVLLWSVFTAVWWWRNFLDYYLDAWIITDHGIIALQWEGWFHRTSQRILYSDVQGVTYEIRGLLGTLNRYGTLSIEKISTGAAVRMSHIRHPKRIETIILHNMEAYLHKKNLKNAKHVQDLLAEFVSEKIQLRDLPAAKMKEEQNRTIITRRV